MPQSQMLELTHEKLGWPESAEIWDPSGAGPKVYAGLANKKIGEKIKREFPEETEGIKVGILAANPKGDNTEAPLAIVCQFTRPVSNQQLLQKLHQLAWSFCRARSLIIVEPQLLRVWSCCEPPKENVPVEPVFQETDLSSQAANALQWVELVSGEFFQERQGRFQRTGAADQMLLSNLKELRRQLENDGLAIETIHDLLARIIFIQFLFQKQDSDGKPALNERVLNDLHRQGILSTVYTDLPGILNNFDDTYNLFRWLNNKFNGDLFPGKGETEAEREVDWQTEIQKVYTGDNRYLTKLAEFVRGDLKMENRQLCLWKFYSFDVIPLDFISSIYEEFVQKDNKPKKSTKSIKQPKGNNSVHYTPEYIVDFILDGVLPWNEINWDLKILDPACGSGIFLVKAFQRLIYRWESSHDDQSISVDVLKNLLKNNIFGIDIDKEAVRVASFSLYMTMLDSLDPSQYWDNELRFPEFFPKLRGNRLIAADFFREDKEGFRTKIDANTYDLVLGNAPWGDGLFTTYAESWQNRKENNKKWVAPDKNIGLLFLPKAAALTKLGGKISMMQPAFMLLLSQSSKATTFRNNLLSEFCVEEVVNLSIVRFGLFKNAISPACIITFSVEKPDDEVPIYYICPKSSKSNEENYHIRIDPQDINLIYQQEAKFKPLAWTVLMWGGRRDLNLIEFLSPYESLATYKANDLIQTRQGVIRGDRKKDQEEILGRRGLWAAKFPEGTFLTIDPYKLEVNNDPMTHSKDSTDFSAFEIPQLILKQSWNAKIRRFQAAIVEFNEEINQGIICSESCVSVHSSEEHINILKTACLIYNSKLSVYYLFLANGFFASYRPYVLIDDLLEYTLRDFKENHSSPGRQKTNRKKEPELTDYCEYFFRVIKAGFGKDKNVCATIFQEPNNKYLPVRLVAIYLNKSIHDGIKIESVNSQDLFKLLQNLNDSFIKQDNVDTGGIFYQRVARVYECTNWQGEQVPTIYLIKPDKIRYWTRSMALRDADEVSADIMFGHNSFA